MMARNKTVRSLIAFILIAILSISLFSIGVAATETTVAAETSETETTASDADAAAETTAEETTAVDDTVAEEEGLGLSFYISMGVLVVLIGVGAFFGIKNKEKVGKWLRSYKSELKKIVWMPWSEVRKNTIVVIIVVIALGIAIGMLDYVFSKGIIALGNLV